MYPSPSKKIYVLVTRSYWGNHHHHHGSVFCLSGTPNRWATTCNHFPQARTQTVSTAKKAAFIAWGTGGYICRWGFPHGLTGRTVKLQNWEDAWLVLLLESQSCRCLLLGLQSHKRGQSTLFHHSPLGLGLWQHGWPLQDFPGAGMRCWLAGGVNSWITVVMGWARGLETW